jgi:hypothetical protein
MTPRALRMLSCAVRLNRRIRSTPFAAKYRTCFPVCVALRLDRATGHEPLTASECTPRGDSRKEQRSARGYARDAFGQSEADGAPRVQP